MSSSSSTVEATPPWLELPREITATILHKLGPIGILAAAEKVCTAWRSVCQDPSMWRCIDMRYSGVTWEMELSYDLEKICRHAVDRSEGQLIDINIEYFGSNDLLLYISQRSRLLKRLQLAFSYGVTSEGLIEAVKNLPLLEELHLSHTFIDVEAIKTIGQSCPLLKTFKLNSRWYKHQIVCDLEAQAIAWNMPELRHLQLIANKMTNEGLQAILDRCPHLESLDLSQCFNVRLVGNVGKLCSERIKDLRHPYDSTDDYRSGPDVYDSETSDGDHITGLSDIDVVSYPNGFLEFSGSSDYDYVYDDAFSD